MNCYQQFSVYQLDDFSIESEFYHTDNCLSNKLKISIFTFYLILWTILLFWITVVLINNCIVTQFKMTLVKLLYAILIFGAMGGVCSHALFLSGVQHFAKFLVLPVSSFCVRWAIGLLLFPWFKTSLGFTVTPDNEMVKKFTIFVNFLNIICYLVYLICFMIGPMIADSQKNYSLLNWFYVFGVSLSGIDNFAICLIVFYVTKKIVELCTTDMDTVSDDVKHFCQKMSLLNKISIFCLSFETVFIILPFWMFDSRNSPYGLTNIFYFHFLVYENAMFCGIFVIFCMVSKKGSMFGFNTSKNGDSSFSPTKSVDKPIRISMNMEATDKIIVELGKIGPE